MHLQALLVVVSFQLCVAILPVIFQKDNTVIATEPVKASLPQEHQFVSVHYPYYEVVKESSNVPEGILLPPSDSLPEDLIEIAATKLGITDWDQIPSVSALGELLGTTTREETIDTIRQLTATESGIDLIKAFIEASDYTDNTATEQPIQIEADTSGPSLPTSLVSETLQKDLEIAQKVFTTPKPELGFFARISSYLGLFDLFPDNQEIAIAPVNKEVQEFRPRSHNKHHESHHQRAGQMQSDPIHLNIPDSFPVPFLPGVDSAYTSLLAKRSHPVRDDDEIPQF